MDTGVNEFPGLDPQEVTFLEGIRARRLRRSQETVREVSPWVVAAAGIISGIVLAALIITAAYLTPPLGR